MDQNQIESLARGVGKLAAGALVAHGVIDAGMTEVVIGLAVSVALLIWGAWHQKRRDAV